MEHFAPMRMYEAILFAVLCFLCVVFAINFPMMGQRFRCSRLSFICRLVALVYAVGFGLWGWDDYHSAQSSRMSLLHSSPTGFIGQVLVIGSSLLLWIGLKIWMERLRKQKSHEG